MKRGTIYLAGPMTGYPEQNYPAFDAAARILEKLGWVVINPADSYSRNQRMPYQMYMRAAINLLLQADALALMPNWEFSKGAKMESLLAQRLGLPVYNAHTGHRMRFKELTVCHPTVIRDGSKPYGAELRAKLIPVAKKLATDNKDGITVDDVREYAEEWNLFFGDETPNELISGLNTVMDAAGLVNIGTTRMSKHHNRDQLVWFENLVTARKSF